MGNEPLVCWKCGASLDEVPFPLSRYAECLACRSELHVCRMCRFYDVRLAQDCAEPIAEEVKDKTRANFCELFEARPAAFSPGEDSPGATDIDALNALFGEQDQQGPASSATDDHQRALDELFGGAPKVD